MVKYWYGKYLSNVLLFLQASVGNKIQLNEMIYVYVNLFIDENARSAEYMNSFLYI